MADNWASQKLHKRRGRNGMFRATLYFRISSTMGSISQTTELWLETWFCGGADDFKCNSRRGTTMQSLYMVLVLAWRSLSTLQTFLTHRAIALGALPDKTARADLGRSQKKTTADLHSSSLRALGTFPPSYTLISSPLSFNPLFTILVSISYTTCAPARAVCSPTPS